MAEEQPVTREDLMDIAKQLLAESQRLAGMAQRAIRASVTITAKDSSARHEPTESNDNAAAASTF